MNKKKLLLSCCAPCSCAVIERFALDGKNFSVLFYNPNISPKDEYQKRLIENKKLCADFNVPFVELEYEHEAWLDAVKGLEAEPERGRRCEVCFYFRLKKAAAWAKENGFSEFTSVLGVSKYKDFAQVLAAAARAAREEDIKYNETNYRKNGLEERRRALTKEKQMYNQQYCGCAFSKRK